MNTLGRLLQLYVDTLFGAICRGTSTLWLRRMKRFQKVGVQNG